MCNACVGDAHLFRSTFIFHLGKQVMSSDDERDSITQSNSSRDHRPLSRRDYLQYTGAAAIGSLTISGTAVADAENSSNGTTTEETPTPTELTAEYEAEPINLDPSGDRPPRLSWKLENNGRDITQTAYQIRVGTSLDKDEADIWDSGRVMSSRSTTVEPDGVTLESDTTYYWTVRVWGDDGTASPWSEPKRFATALSDNDAHWDGEWIGNENTASGTNEEGNASDPSPLLRTDTTIDGTIESARAHVSALGYGELYINGERIGNEELNPGWTQYEHSVLYSTYDVTDVLETGENGVGLWLGQGWFSMDDTPSYIQWDSFGPPRALLQLNVTYEDGTTDVITTDSSWHTTASPIVENHLYNGETYDARRDLTGWTTEGFDDSDWSDATEMAPPSDDFELRPQRLPPIKVTETLDPESITEKEDGYLVDFGQNHSGWLELTATGTSKGDEIVMQHGEVLNEEGDLVTANLRTAEATDRYIANGAGQEVYEPRFTYHGFRYAKITGYPGTLTVDDVRSKVVHTDIKQTGGFTCSNNDLNQVQHNAVWGLRSNSHSVPTDCPQRDERLGWTGDAHMSIWSEVLNFDAVRFQEKWMDDHENNQFPQGSQSNTIPMVRRAEDAENNPGWKDADPNWGKTRVVIPWRMYQYTGDERVLETHYDGMKQYVNYWDSQADGHVIPVDKTHYGDWLAFEPWRSDPSLFGTFAHYQTTDAFARIAEVLEKKNDAERYRARSDAIAGAFNDAYFDPGANQYGSGTQTTYALPLFMGIVPNEHEQAVVENLIEKIRTEDGGKLQTGFIGTRPLIFSLVEYGYENLAYHIVSQPEAPGWVYMARNGATTMWERWDSDEQIGSGMNSFNHRPWTLVSEWFYRKLAGIDTEEPGFRSVEIAPVIPDDLDWADGKTETVRGTVAARWERIETPGKSRTHDGLTLDATIPGNATGRVRVPTLGGEKVRVREGGTPIWNNGNRTRPNHPGVKRVERDGDAIVVTVDSGTYQFELEQLGNTRV